MLLNEKRMKTEMRLLVEDQENISRGTSSCWVELLGSILLLSQISKNAGYDQEDIQIGKKYH